jgi:hypothetical protein
MKISNNTIEGMGLILLLISFGWQYSRGLTSPPKQFRGIHAWCL